jgi:hypothetical protein
MTSEEAKLNPEAWALVHLLQPWAESLGDGAVVLFVHQPWRTVSQVAFYVDKYTPVEKTDFDLRSFDAAAKWLVTQQRIQRRLGGPRYD